MDKCTYTTKRDIPLSLEYQSVSSCFIKLQYWDRINTNAVKATAMYNL